MPNPTRRLTAATSSGIILAAVLGGCNLSRTSHTGYSTAVSTAEVVVLPLTYGQATTLRFDPATAAALRGAGVAITPTGTAAPTGLGAPGVAFPITAGYAEVHLDHSASPGYVQGSLYHQGSGLRLSDGTGSVTLGDLVVDPGGSALYGTVDGRFPQVRLATLDGSRLTVDATTPVGVAPTSPDQISNVALDGSVVHLTAEAAAALDAALGTSALTPGTTLGTASIALAGQAVTYRSDQDHVTAVSRLTGQATTLTLLPAAAQALGAAGITPHPDGSATATGTAITLPITGGMVAVHSFRGFSPGYVVGSILHQGSGVTFDGPGGASLATGDYVVDPGDSVLTATVGGRRDVPLFALDGSQLQVSSSGGVVTLDGTVARLTSEAARALDETFATSAFTPGLAVGTVHLVAQGQPGS